MEKESNLTNAYFIAYGLACEELRKSDWEQVALNSNAIFNRTENKLVVKYLNTDYIVNCLTGEVALSNSQDQVTTTVKVIILHYLLHSKVKPLSGRAISFKEVPGGGAIYYPTFQKRAIAPLVKTFEKKLDRFFTAADKLGGIKEKYGHASVTINILPLVPVTYVIWQGDEEVESSGTILFDETITSYLPVEDIVCAASFGTYELMKMSR